MKAFKFKIGDEILYNSLRFRIIGRYRTERGKNIYQVEASDFERCQEDYLDAEMDLKCWMLREYEINGLI